MVSLSWTTRREDGVTLVELRVAGDGDPVRARLACELDGPVWPPRRNGVPEPGWDDGGFEGTVPGEGTLALGFASPAEPVDPPVSVARTEPVDEAVGFEPRADVPAVDPSPEGVVGALGPPVPPRDAVPLPDGDSRRTEGSRPPEPAVGDRGATRRAPDRDPADPGGGLPPAVAGWLAAVDDRADRAERLAAVETLPEATAAVESAGGLARVERLAATVEADRRALDRLAARVARLRERTRGVEVPVETFRRLA